MRAAEVLDVDVMDYDAFIDLDADTMADLALAITSGYSGALYAGDDTTLFAYNDGAKLKVLYRSFDPTGSGAAGDGSLTVAPVIDETTPDAEFVVTPSTPLDIPDDSDWDMSGVTETATVTGCGTVIAARLEATITHDFPGDVTFYLSSPGDAVSDIEMIDASGSTGGTFTFDSGDPEFAFDGVMGNGDWTVLATDNYAADTGTVDAFTLQLWCL